MALELRVSGAGGRLCAVCLEATSTLQELKAAIEASASVPTVSQRLFLEDQELFGCGRVLSELLSRYTQEQDLLLVRRTQEQVRLLEELTQLEDFEVYGWLRKTPAEVRRDKDVVLAAISRDGKAFSLASAELQDDRDVILAAIAQNVWRRGLSVRRDASDECNDVIRRTGLSADREFVLAAIARDGQFFFRASAQLKADRDVALAAVARDGRVLSQASAEVKADREVVLAAVAQNGLALLHASAQLKADRGVVLTAVAQDRRALLYASAALKVDSEVVEAADAQ